MKISLPAMIGTAAMALALLAFLAVPAQARSAQAGAGAVAKSVRHAQARPKARHKARPAKRRATSGARPAKRYRADSPRRATLAALRSSAVLIIDPSAHKVLYEKNADAVMPIASVTKLMTALVVIGAGQDMDEVLTVADADVDRLKYSSSRLRVGTSLARSGMLHIALMSSENRAASALGRHYPGGTPAFVLAMNAKARALGMHHSRFVEPTGLSSLNVSTPEDLARLVIAAQQQPLIRTYSTDPDHTIAQGRQATVYRNSNRLIASPSWHIGTQKTGYISEAGRCMVLHAKVKGRAVVMIFLDAQGKFSRARDANQVRSWLARARR
ncbi:serine hydrolase [Massilia pseudoviolaceinigra]|uniref:serine hydrolase n=1 Tax=Massilia pseudoviolaceinigra TaxID=3057165 RepID=UPI00279681C1|nr:serine hydrolase [Massilia sp. CCM 9206]MDQ1921559.1 serine hydrolase [Massilia sp. CCM 9206]